MSYHVRIFGVEYKSVKSAYDSLDFPVSYRYLTRVLRECDEKNISSELERILTDIKEGKSCVCKNKHGKRKEFTCRGKSYTTILGLYRDLDVPCPYGSFRRALKGIPLDKIDSRIDDVMKKLSDRSNSKHPEILGVQFGSIMDACDSFGVSRAMVSKRKERGCTVTEQYLGKVKEGYPRILNKAVVAVLLKNALLRGVEYSDSVEFFEGDEKCTLDREAKELAARFIGYCKEGYEQYQAYQWVFEE